MTKYIFSAVLFGLLMFANPNLCMAKDYNIKKMTPEVTVALENRRERFAKIKKLKKELLIGENNNGYISVLKHDTSIVATIEAENNDRRVIYNTIAQQNDLGDAINIIEKVFARVQREKAEPGEKIQLENGKWSTK